jgi:hypothetical protein
LKSQDETRQEFGQEIAIHATLEAKELGVPIET